MKNFIILITALAALAGCQSRKAEETQVEPRVRAPRLEKGDIRRVRTDPYVETYHVGRTIDRKKNMMHESHRVYRLAVKEKWDQRPMAQPLQSHGPVLGIMDPLAVDLPRDEKIEAELNRQKSVSKDLEALLNEVESQVADLKKERSYIQDNSGVIAQLKEKLEKADQELAQYKERLEGSEAEKAALMQKVAAAEKAAAEAGADIKAEELKEWGSAQF